ncbi:2-keto-4-pentenoate hydratase/2-oxohepta-3-ene-1,7-dioic acid hydratase (catechol pathway) [Lentzea albidocapillata subsp. violacea]|uniref:2-keto-4-pentenoate hydratase/2-oxohepta-3-ene-1,7-dioic acid hydratase (Catechol pathway) n=1 Tax=Lentzea albidocapillata subsp. violacea TaxID=128104 RepID=A0A1G8R8V0_9PSEU|nr:fumarylacetoacetate hydrolase family protein [Lentzea albidocapillata]SDJ13396.1 2-keto-4-pentenoate hydratase/2-oxohepta-3-ene-1,7-dioic acid hydratase (catechol pathway) [Lentzea albidocapillata subsp. violacea]
MKLASVTVGGVRRGGVVDGESIALLSGTVDDVVRGAPVETGEVLPLAEVRLEAPLHRFNRDVLCTGWNYWDHFEESAGKREGQDPVSRPLRPTFFTKGPDTVVGPHDAIAYDPGLSQKWDYEAEIAMVIGRDGRSIPEEKALDHVFGFLVANDVSQRDLQRAHGGQWLKGKSLDATMPLGPWLTTADEIGDLGGLRVQCEVNGVLLQDATSAQMAFSFARIIAELSHGMTLRAGDVILTGTPSGVGNAREPQLFLRDGDVVVTRVSGLGELRNTVTLTDLGAR